jgi:outer membrane lipoprotein-sorting protein
MKNINLLLIVLLLVEKSLFAQAEDMTAREIIDKSQEQSRVDGMESISKLTIVDPKGRERIRKITLASKSEADVDKTIIKFLEPADIRGTGMLIYDYPEKIDDMWIYMPALRKTRRIVSSEKSKSFMGSEFTNADMAVPTLDDFNFEKTGSAMVGDKDCIMIESIPKTEDIADENGFSKKVAYVGKDDFLVHQVDYYDLDGDKEKLMRIRGYELLDADNHKYTAREMHIENLINHRKSMMIMEQVQLNPDLKDELFTTAYLEQ